MAGRRPKPTALKQITGNPGKRKLNHREPQPQGIPDCPRHLDREARREWRRIAPELVRLRILTSVDRAPLAAYCQAWSRWVDAETHLREQGAVIQVKKRGVSYPARNPYLIIANRSLDQLRKFAVEFGITPGSRSRIKVPEQAPENPFEELAREADGKDKRPN